jgi:PKD repeat protein
MQRVALALVALIALTLPAAASASYGDPSPVSIRAAAGTGTAGGPSQRASGSTDGRYVVFDSQAPAQDLVGGATDPNFGDVDVYLRDRQTGTTTLISHQQTSVSTTGDGASSSAAISPDGRFVAYVSSSSDLVSPAVVDGQDHVYLYDRNTTTNVLVDHAVSLSTPGDGAAGAVAAVSSDGRVVYTSDSSNLVSGTDANGARDVFVYSGGTNQLVSHAGTAQSGTASDGTDAGAVSASADAQRISFTSNASDIVSGTTLDNVYLWVSGTTRLVSHSNASATAEANGASLGMMVSADGASVLYEGDGDNVVPSQSDVATGPGSGDIFLYDVAATTSVLVSHQSSAPNVATNNLGSVEGSVSGDGQRVAWLSQANDVVGPNPDARMLIYLYERGTGANTLVSHSTTGATDPASGDSDTPVVSPDGSRVAYVSQATDLVSPATSGTGDVFAWDRASATNSLVSHAAGSPAVNGNAPSLRPRFAGSLLLFESDASNLFTPDGGGRDVFAGGSAPPTASFTATPGSGTAPLDVSFNATASDPDGSIVSYAWSFGDGASGSGASVTHRYAAAGNYTVTLTVTDDSGTTATATRSIAVAAAPPPGGGGGPPPAKPSLTKLVSALLKSVGGTCHVRKRSDFALVVCGGNKQGKPDLRAFVVNARTASLTATIAAVEGKVSYPKRKLTVASGRSKGVTLKAPSKVRAALKRGLRKHKSVVRRPKVTLTGSGLAKTSVTHKLTVRRARGK